MTPSIISENRWDADAEGLDDEQLWLAAAQEMNGDHADATRQLTSFLDRHGGLRIDADYLRLLRAPAFADCREQLLAALTSAGYRRQQNDRRAPLSPP